MVKFSGKYFEKQKKKHFLKLKKRLSGRWFDFGIIGLGVG
jgi:hypothetical protein